MFQNSYGYVVAIKQTVPSCCFEGQGGPSGRPVSIDCFKSPDCRAASKRTKKGAVDVMDAVDGQCCTTLKMCLLM